ncbi:prolactin-releasing peptide receptor-like [Oculina patagonica]
MYFNNTTIIQGANLTQSAQAVDIIIEPKWLAIVRLTVESIIALAGVIGNFVVCLTITRHRTLNTASTNAYIRNVAIGDLATLLVSFPLGIVREQFTYWPLGEFTCRYVFPLSDMFFGVSVWSIAAIAVDRHRILSANFPGMARKSLKVPRIVCAAIWLISLLAISLPLILVYGYHKPPDAEPLCLAVWPNHDLPVIYSIAVSLFTYAIPLSLIFVTYCTIKRKLNKSDTFHLEMADRRFNGSFKSSQVSLVKTRSRRFNKIMTPVVVVFAITVLPLSVFRVAGLFYFSNPVFQKYAYVMFRICFFFYLFNSACNPLIYAFVTKRFRQSFREMLAWA